MRNSTMDDARLIKEIRKHPEIYDRQHSDYKNSQHRSEMWEIIAKKTNFESGK